MYSYFTKIEDFDIGPLEIILYCNFILQALDIGNPFKD